VDTADLRPLRAAYQADFGSEGGSEFSEGVGVLGVIPHELFETVILSVAKDLLSRRTKRKQILRSSSALPPDGSG
jgi:hypothetical protein